jgi:poly [ADP-ribose] polymerase
MPEVKAWKEGSAGEPTFPSSYEVVKKAVLQVTDIKSNHNKYYAIEIHTASNKFRVYTHYGRTDDLDSNPNAGCRESRYLSSFDDAERLYNTIYNQKTSPRKGYKEVNLASSRIGSSKSIGQSSGHVDTKTLEKISGGNTKEPAAKKESILNIEVQELVSHLYEEATNALTSTVNAKITANGIETPLGVLTLGQIEKGQSVLDEAWGVFNKSKSSDKLIDLSGEFYSAIPHRIGRTREAINEAVINSLEAFNQKQETLQLMRDMLSVNSKDSQVLFNPEIDKKYMALNCKIDVVSGAEFDKVKKYVESSQIKCKSIKVKKIYSINREEESLKDVGNIKQLFHGSRAKNWVGILSRGLLLPKIVVSMGISRTDAGWLGNGIYFGDAVCTTLYYTSSSRKRNTRLMTVADVALGKVKEFRKITYGLNSPPDGYDSCHGVRGSQFADDEFVVYNNKQQKLKYLVEYAG